MNVVAVMGALGGAGATTVAAHLAAAFSLRQRQTYAFDFAIENRLRLHFGMALDDRSGWALNLIEGKQWHTAAFRSESGQQFVPFGRLNDDAQLDQLIDRLKSGSQWFQNQLRLLRVVDEAIVVVNCPRMPAALRDQVLAAADIVLLVVAPDSMSCMEAARVVSDARQRSDPQVLAVLNGFDASRQLDRDISLLLRTQYKEVFSPVVIHRDESLREAVACKQTVFGFAPSSQAAYDFFALATWMSARIGQLAEDDR